MPLGPYRLFRRRQAAWWTLAAGLAVTAVLGWHLHHEAVALDRQRLALRVAEIQSQLDSRLEKSEMLLHNLRDYLMWSGNSREKVFQRWCYENGLTINCKWVLGIAVATNRTLSPWPSTLPKPAQTWSETDLNNLVREVGNRRIECKLAWRSELKNKTRFLEEYDLDRSFYEEIEGERRRSHDRLVVVIRNSSMGMGPRQIVMQEEGGNPITGTLFFVPIYRPELADQLAETSKSDLKSSRTRWLLLSALIVAPVDFNILVQSVWDGAEADVGVEVFSSTNQTAETWMNAGGSVPRAADPMVKAYLTLRQVWPMYRHEFSLFFYTKPLFEAQSPRRLAGVAVAAGTGLTLLATALVGVALRARNRQELLTDQIREARDALAAAQQERNKISRDLHDGTIQSLYAVQLGLGHTLKKLEAEPAKAGNELSAVRRELDSVIAEIRQFITAETGAGKPVDFGAVLNALVQRAQAGTAAQIDLQCDPAASARLDGDQAVQLANIAREALSNSLRHANPRRVQVELRLDQEMVRLVIADDGSGFDPKSPRRNGVGLTSMASRAREAGGTLDVQASPEQGTRILVCVPAQPIEPVEADSPTDSPADSKDES